MKNYNENDHISKYTKHTVKTLDSASKGNFNDYQIMNMNKTGNGNFRGDERKLQAVTTTNGFFNKTSTKLIRNSLTIKD